MGRFCRVVVMLLLAVQLAACASTAALESQSRQRDSRLARLYFVREKGALGAMGARAPAAEIKVDGKTVGAVSNGSYIFVDRPPGLHQLSVETSLSGAFETEAQVDAGGEYYFEIAPQRTGAPGTDLVHQVLIGGNGEPMRAKSPLSAAFAGFGFDRLDPSTGAAAVERLKGP
jgi:Protein of unknown function (DUF2846)